MSSYTTRVLGIIAKCSKSSVLKSFLSRLKLKAGVFKFVHLEERFRRGPFSEVMVITACEEAKSHGCHVHAGHQLKFAWKQQTSRLFIVDCSTHG